MKVNELLQRVQIDYSMFASSAGIGDPMLRHHSASALHRARHARFAHKKMMRFFRQHEAAGTRQRIEARLGQRRQLEFSVPVGEKSEHEECEPMICLLVKCSENAGIIRVPRSPLQKICRLFTSVFTEITVQEVNHCPQMPALFYIHLEKIAHVIERGRSPAQQALLLNRCRLRIALRDDDSS